MRLGFFGGSFDPPHLSHVLAAAYVLSSHQIDHLLVVPTAEHPFGKNLTSFAHRKHMVELAFGMLKGLEVSDLEQRLGGQSRTLRTLQTLQSEHPSAALRLIIGSDNLASFTKWYGAEQIRKLAPPLVVQRAGHVTDPTQPALPMVSSTEIRRRIQAGESTTGLISERVAQYIAQEGLYRASP